MQIGVGVANGSDAVMMAAVGVTQRNKGSDSDSNNNNNNSSSTHIGGGATMPSEKFSPTNFGVIKQEGAGKELLDSDSDTYHLPHLSATSQNSPHIVRDSHLFSAPPTSNKSPPQVLSSSSSNCSSSSSEESHSSAKKKKPHRHHQQQQHASQHTQSHLNGTMQDIFNLQKLQSYAQLQREMPPGPLNLTVGGASGQLTPPHMPQLILSAGQLVQGIQGAQLLIPTSQGVTTQTVLTIPVSQQIATNITMDQLMQSLFVLNAAPLIDGAANGTSGLSPRSLLANGAQQLLTAIQPQLLALQQSPPSSGHRECGKQRHLQRRHNGRHSSASNSPRSPAAQALSSINRLAATNGEITITKAQPSPPQASQPPYQPPYTDYHPFKSEPSKEDTPTMKLSPASMQMSPNAPPERDDLLGEEEPNEPTINEATSNIVDGIDLDDIKEFAKAFKLRRLSLGLTQTQVGQALSVTEGPAYSQSAICSALAAQMYAAAQLSSQQQQMFEKLDITPKSAQKIKPVLERWMKEAEESSLNQSYWHRYKSGQSHLTDFIGVEPSKKRKRRTSFTPQALELLNAHFERNTHPSGTEITGLAHQLGYEREVIRIWFCNKRQALKNTVRMMSKGMV